MSDNEITFNIDPVDTVGADEFLEQLQEMRDEASRIDTTTGATLEGEEGRETGPTDPFEQSEQSETDGGSEQSSTASPDPEQLQETDQAQPDENYDDIPLDAEEISAELLGIKGQVKSLTATLENLIGAIELLPARMLPVLQTVLEMGGGNARPTSFPKPAAPASATEKSEARKAADAANLATINAIKERRS